MVALYDKYRILVNEFKEITGGLETKIDGKSTLADIGEYIVELVSFNYGMEVMFLNKDNNKKYASIYVGKIADEEKSLLDVRNFELDKPEDSDVLDKIYKIYKKLKE